MKRLIGLALIVAGAVLGIVAYHVQVHAHHPSDKSLSVVAIALSFLAAGLVAWNQRPANRMGPLMVLTGFALLARQRDGTDTLVRVDGAWGSKFDDTLTGSSHGDYLLGDAGNDTLSGLGGADMLEGDPGDDAMNGGGGTDLGWYGDSATAVHVDLAHGTATGEGSDRLTSIENLVGSQHSDVLIGSSARNTMDAKGGNDRLYGAGGNDVFAGGSGKDTLYGGIGKDALDGGPGRDYADGGPARDVCHAERKVRCP